MLSEDDMVNADQPPNQTPTYLFIFRDQNTFRIIIRHFIWGKESKQVVSRKGEEINCQSKITLHDS